MTDVYDLEQQISECWGIINDIDLLLEVAEDLTVPSEADHMCNALLGLRTIYDLKYQRLWRTYENVLAGR